MTLLRSIGPLSYLSSTVLTKWLYIFPVEWNNIFNVNNYEMICCLTFPLN